MNQKGFALIPTVLIWVVIPTLSLLVIFKGIEYGNITLSESLKKDVQNQIVSSDTISSGSASTIPQSLPTPPIIPKSVAVTVNDPIVDCVSDWERKQGLSNKAKKSVCDTWIDCQLADRVYKSPKDMCDKYQKKLSDTLQQLQQKKEQAGMINCQIQSGWVVMKEEDCKNAQDAWKNQLTNSINEQVKKDLHEKNLRDMELYLQQQGLSREEIDAELYKFDQQMKAQGL